LLTRTRWGGSSSARAISCCFWVSTTPRISRAYPTGSSGNSWGWRFPGWVPWSPFRTGRPGPGRFAASAFNVLTCRRSAAIPMFTPLYLRPQFLDLLGEVRDLDALEAELEQGNGRPLLRRRVPAGQQPLEGLPRLPGRHLHLTDRVLDHLPAGL